MHAEGLLEAIDQSMLGLLDQRLAAQGGDAKASFELGVTYVNEEGDYAQAFQWFRAAAEQGYADAQYVLGKLYANGDGVTQDYVEAYAWIGTAAGQGFTGTTMVLQSLREAMTPSQRKRAVDLAREYREIYVVH